jgi:glycerate 2-kinase
MAWKMTRTTIEIVSEIFSVSIKAVSPYESVKKYCADVASLWKTGNFKRLVVVGFGKASCLMARAIEQTLPDLVDTGLIIAKYGHCLEKPLKMRVHEAGHPLPDENGVKGTNEIADILKKADRTTLVVCLISGGGSALLVSPCEGVSLQEKQIVTDLLLRSGADIHELNTLRKHISRVKGGRLAEAAYPAHIVSLIVSDVIGDEIGVIASGPTAPDRTTYGDALRVIKKHALLEKVPKNILKVLYDGCQGVIPDTPKEGNAIFEKVRNLIVADNKTALEAAREKASDLGYHAKIISPKVRGEAREAGKWLAGVALEVRNASRKFHNEKICLISGGETTVTVRKQGRGGRNMELALSFAIEIEGYEGLTLLSAGTDGIDGPTDAAGAIVNGRTIGKANAAGLDAAIYLKDNDSYSFFKQIDGLFITGPTGTNVMDLQLILIE